MDEEWRTVWGQVWGQASGPVDFELLNLGVWARLFTNIDREIYTHVSGTVEEQLYEELEDG